MRGELRGGRGERGGLGEGRWGWEGRKEWGGKGEYASLALGGMDATGYCRAVPTVKQSSRFCYPSLYSVYLQPGRLY